VTALTSPYERIDSLKIGAGYEAPPRRRRVRQPRHHDCPNDSLQALQALPCSLWNVSVLKQQLKTRWLC